MFGHWGLGMSIQHQFLSAGEIVLSIDWSTDKQLST